MLVVSEINFLIMNIESFDSNSGAMGCISCTVILVQASSYIYIGFNPFCANPTKWSKTRKQFVGNLPANSLSVFDHFVGFVLKRVNKQVNLL